MSQTIVEGTQRSRRALLAGVFGGIAAVALEGIGRATPVGAANGDAVKVGQAKSGSSLTAITSSSSAFKGKTTGSTTSGVIGESTSGSGFGVNGFNTASSGTPIGVRGAVNPGGGIGVAGFGPRGVLGQTVAPNGTGVAARNEATTGDGSGLRASALSPAATAVEAENSATSDLGAGFAIHAIATTRTTVKVENVSGTSGQGHAIHAISNLGDGVFAENLSSAVALPRSSAVRGKGTEFGVEGHGGRIGVFGHVDDDVPSLPAGTKMGVRGWASDLNAFAGSFENGANNGNGFALHAKGGLRIQGAAGTATIASGQREITVSPPAPIRSGTFVLATLQSDAGGVAVERVNVSGATPLSFTIRLTGNASQSCTVGWLVVTGG